MTKETGLTKNEIITNLTRSTHGALQDYVPLGVKAIQADPEFFAHLIAWNQVKGAVRDSKTALPVVGLSVSGFPFYENSLAHMGLLSPRDFLKAVELVFALSGTMERRRSVKRLVERYLRFRETSYGFWERAIISHRRSMLDLYCRFHLKPESEAMRAALFDKKYVKGSALDVISRLKHMEPKEALGYVMKFNIPFLTVQGTLGPKLKDTDVMLALIKSMSSTELVSHGKMLERYGVKSNPALRAAFQEGLKKAADEAPTQALLKASKAAKHLGADLAKDMTNLQERQLKTSGGVKGRWAILGDMSSSMRMSIEVSRFIAGHLARVAEEAHLVFFNSSPRYYNVTGKSLQEIEEVTKHIMANGGTDCFIGLQYLADKGIMVDGVVVVSDGGHNYPSTLHPSWVKYCKKFDNEPTLYFYKVAGSDRDTFSPTLKDAGVGMEMFDLTHSNVDYYALPNLIATMNTKRWTLLDQIMEQPLLTLDEVFTMKGKESQNERVAAVA